MTVDTRWLAGVYHRDRLDLIHRALTVARRMEATGEERQALLTALQRGIRAKSVEQAAERFIADHRWLAMDAPVGHGLPRRSPRDGR